MKAEAEAEVEEERYIGVLVYWYICLFECKCGVCGRLRNEGWG